MSVCPRCRNNIYTLIINIRYLREKNESAEKISEYLDKLDVPLCCRPAILTTVYPKDLEKKIGKTFDF